MTGETNRSTAAGENNQSVEKGLRLVRAKVEAKVCGKIKDPWGILVGDYKRA